LAFPTVFRAVLPYRSMPMMERISFKVDRTALVPAVSSSEGFAK
jgi:hypothetical protein